MSTKYTTFAELAEGYEHHDKLRSETDSLARTAARSLARGDFEGARKQAAQFDTLDKTRFEFLMTLSAATHELCGVAS